MSDFHNHMRACVSVGDPVKVQYQTGEYAGEVVRVKNSRVVVRFTVTKKRHRTEALEREAVVIYRGLGIPDRPGALVALVDGPRDWLTRARRLSTSDPNTARALCERYAQWRAKPDTYSPDVTVGDQVVSADALCSDIIETINPQKLSTAH
jgi:hypothetical protein